MKLLDMTWEEAKGKQSIVLPIGSIEQHGPHLPLGTDTLVAEAVSNEIAARLNAVVGPSIVPGVSKEHMDFPGTLTLSEETFVKKIEEVCKSLQSHGFTDVMLVNGHGGNKKALSKIELAGVMVVDIIPKIKGYDHAGCIETSLMLYLHPEKVRGSLIRKHDFKFPGKGEWRTIEHSKSGVLGDPTVATAIRGEEYFRKIVDGIMEEIGHGR
jgi:creatinine amidohydrolase